MKFIFFLSLAVAALFFLLYPQAASEQAHAIPEPVVCEPEIVEVEVEIEVPVPIEIPVPDGEVLTHAQETWISALEWCESRANPSAINPLDNDGTPSFYSWQFKPATFRLFGELYHVIEQGHTDAEIMELIKDYDLQKAILRNMVEDPSIRWEGQFPACVRMLGRPPAY